MPNSNRPGGGLAYHDTILSLEVLFVIVMFKENASSAIGDIMNNPFPFLGDNAVNSVTQHL